MYGRLLRQTDLKNNKSVTSQHVGLVEAQSAALVRTEPPGVVGYEVILGALHPLSARPTYC